MQWSAWLRRTRREPPTLEELQKDYHRQLRLQENVQRLEQEYQAEKLRLAASNEANLLKAPAVDRSRPARGVDADSPAQVLDASAKKGLPAIEGGVDEATAARAPEIAKNLGLDRRDALEPGREALEGIAPTDASPAELAERRRKQDEAEAAARRAEFGETLVCRAGLAERELTMHTPTAQQNEPFKGKEAGSQEPAGWAPSAPARRR